MSSKIQSDTQSWTIIIFCFNEEGNVGKVIHQAENVLLQLSIDNELVIVDDGSTDNSWEAIQQQAAKYSNIRLIRHQKNMGIGQALISGYTNASKENICAVPADGQFDCNELIPFSYIEENTFISFFRLENTTYNFFRNRLSWFNKFANRIFLGIALNDVNWVKIYKKKHLQLLDLKLKSSLVETEICSKLIASRRKVIEVDSKYLNRESGVSKGASKKIVFQALRDLFKLVVIFHQFKHQLRH